MQQMMDRALRERIIGAVVLVIFAVLVVPIFLDGRSAESEIVSSSVTLPGQNDQQRKQQTIVLERDRSAPVPNATMAAAVPEKSEPEPQASVATPKKEAAPPPQRAPVEKTEASIPAESATGMWAVQLGSFSNQENAERLAASLRDQGYAAFLSQLDTGGGSLHRVRIGPQKDRAGAESIAAQLGKGGHDGQVVPHP